MKKFILLFIFLIIHFTLNVDYCICQWEPDVSLTNNSGYSELPSISASGSVVHVVWEDARDNNWEIYYKRSTDG